MLRTKSPLPIAAAIALTLLWTACNALGLGGNPGGLITSAPDTDDPAEFYRLCDERRQAIRDWYEKEEGILLMEFFGGEKGMREGLEKEEELIAKAEKMTAELDANCASGP